MALTRKAKRACTALSVALLAALAIDAVRLYRTEQVNSAILQGQALELPDAPTPQAWFAQAREFEIKGDLQRALASYKRVQIEGPPALRVAARYNSANAYLRQALELSGEDQRQLMLPLVELAKEGYRAVLRADPSHWDAKYNLERALWLVPEADDELAQEPEAMENAERAVTTMRGRTLGLP
jgi:mxaK protein